MNGYEGVPPDAYRWLGQRLTEKRRARLERTARERTRAIRLVLQDIHDPHNISACLRSAEAFGIQDIDVVTLKEKFSASGAARGVHRWLTINRFYSIEDSVKSLRDQGYKIAAGMPDQSATPIHQLPTDAPIAVVFGNEHDGVSKQWQTQIDIPFTIPMVGLVESLNISVSAAITMHQLTRLFRDAWRPEDYFLREEEQLALLSLWSTRTLRDWQKELQRLREADPG